MSNTPSFSDESVKNAIETAKPYQKQYSALLQQGQPTGIPLHQGRLSALAECISITLNNGEACLNLPLGIGSVCIPVPIAYDGKVAQACLSICTTWGIPTGVKVTISVGGVVIVTAPFGAC